jgi:DNA-binding NarL/FixJ family response regulator
MAKGRAVSIILDEAEKSELASLTRKHGAPQSLAQRARNVLAAVSGLTNKEIAARRVYSCRGHLAQSLCCKAIGWPLR